MKKNSPDVGHKPGAEVQNYLDFLLQEATNPFEEPALEEAEEEVRPVAVKPTPPATPSASAEQQQVQQIAARALPLETKPVLDKPKLLPQIAQAPLKVAKARPVEAKPEPVTAVAETVEPEVAAAPPESGPRDQLPDPFQCLMFEVGTLKLAVPLAELGAICQIVEPLTPLFGQPEWYLGIYSYQGRNIKVVDTGHWVLQDRYSPEIKEQYQFLLTFPDVDWGLAVSGLHEAVHIQQSEVAWRAVRDTCPWMAGVVRKHMCALLDMQQFEHCFSHTEER